MENTQSNKPGSVIDFRLAHLLLRCGIGLALTMHGITRVFVIGAPKFAAGMRDQMLKAHSPLPSALVYPFGLVLPFVELALGLLLLIGLWSRWTFAIGSVLMFVLIFGSGLANDWQGISIQLIYVVIFFLLLLTREYHYYSADAVAERTHDKSAL